MQVGSSVASLFSGFNTGDWWKPRRGGCPVNSDVVFGIGRHDPTSPKNDLTNFFFSVLCCTGCTAIF